jgi:diguanylate cyclase (GGDEF)-like protein
MTCRAWVLVLTALAAVGCGGRPGREAPVARAGALDLSSWDFERDGPVALRGDWAFRYGELRGPRMLSPGENPAPPFIHVPAAWNEMTQGGQRLSGQGFATHGLRLILPDTGRDLALSLDEAYAADRLFVGDRLVFKRGEVAQTAAGEIADVRGRLVPLGEVTGTVDLSLEISNHFHSEGGPIHVMVIGAREQLHAQAESAARLDYLLIGCLLAVGLFYAALSLSRPDPENILFALLTLLLALRTATTRWHIADLVPLDSEGQLRLDYVGFIILPLVFASLIRALFPAEVPRLLPRLAFVYGALALIGPLALSTVTFTHARNLNIAIALAFVATAVLAVARAALMGRQGAGPLLLCCLLVFGVGLRDVGIALRLLPDSRELLPVANTILVFAHALVLGRRLSDALGKSERLALGLRDANETLEARIAARTAELEVMAMTDPLTGLLNRRPLLRLAEAERARAIRSGERVGVMMIDCDDFKRVNDLHGHEAGDRVLRALAQRFTALVRSHDLLGRWGGEEFVMIFSAADTAGGMAAAERLRLHVAEAPFEARPGIGLRLTVTVGVAVLEDRLESFDDLLRRADRALYAGKAKGKNQVVMASREVPEAPA